jgi:protein SCO1/2
LNADKDAGDKVGMLRKIRVGLWALVVLAALAAIAAFVIPREWRTPLQSTTASMPDFTLTGADGKPFSSSRFDGRPAAIFFGFTRCGDVCPTTLSRLVTLRRQAGGERAFEILFITIDPVNDGPAEVGQYASLFGSPIIGLTGSADEIARVKRAFGVFAESNPHATGHGDTMLHSEAVQLFDRNGRRAGTIRASDSTAAAQAKLLALAL